MQLTLPPDVDNFADALKLIPLGKSKLENGTKVLGKIIKIESLFHFPFMKTNVDWLPKSLIAEFKTLSLRMGEI